jgi:hypothetical protein
MAELGPKSLKKLDTCKAMLRTFVTYLVKRLNEINDPELQDIIVTCGLRSKADQEDAFNRGASKLHWPQGPHNNAKMPVLPDDLSALAEEDKSSAVDIVPYPSMWDDEAKVRLLGKYGKQCLEELRMESDIVWGGDWQKFPDTPHWQLNK